VRAVLEDAGAGDGAVPAGPDLTNAAFLGYIYQGLVGQARLNGTGAGEIVKFVQFDRNVWIVETAVLSNNDKAAADTWQVLDNTGTSDLTAFRAAVPPTARTCGGIVGVLDVDQALEMMLAAAKSDGTLATDIIGSQLFMFNEELGGNAYNSFAVGVAFQNLPVRGGASRNFQWKRRLDTANASLSVCSYTF